MKFISVLLQVIFVIFLSLLISYFAIEFNPSIKNLIFSSDGFYTLDLARDILHGKALLGWQFAHSPYFIPDILIAVIVLGLSGFSLSYTLIFISTINILLLITASYFVLNTNSSGMRISFIKTGIVILFSLLLLFVIFPEFTLPNFYQFFQSGAHNGPVLVMLLALVAGERINLPRYKFIFLAIITIITVVSDLYVLVVLMGYMASQIMRACITKNFNDRYKWLILFVSAVIGFLLYKKLPNGVYSGMHGVIGNFHQIMISAKIFLDWLFSSIENILFMILLIVATVIFPLLMGEKYVASFYKKTHKFLASDLVLPSLLIICQATLLGGKGNWSQRYFIFPAIILLWSLALLLCKGLSRFERKIQILILVFITAIVGISAEKVFSDVKSSTIPYEQFPLGEDKVVCIQRAATVYPLEDGVAQYWDARQIKFFSGFSYYLAQTPPPPVTFWGFFYWVNNKYDFFYRDPNLQTPRKYNYILAGKQDVKAWGNVINQASSKYDCGNYEVYYYRDSNVLWKFLFHQDFAKMAFWAKDLPSLTGHIEGNTRIAGAPGDKPNFISYGPDVVMLTGSYVLRIYYSSNASSTMLVGQWDVFRDSRFKKTQLIGDLQGTDGESRVLSIPFNVSDRNSYRYHYQFRVKWNGVNDLRIEKIELLRE